MSQAPPPPDANSQADPAAPTGAGDGNTQILAVVSLICAAIAIPCLCCCWPVSLGLSVAAVITAYLARKQSKDTLTTIALVTSIVITLLALLMSTISLIMIATGQNEKLMQRLEDMMRDMQQGGAMTSYEPMQVYYYDLRTGELFTAVSTDIPPIEAPSGPARGEGTQEAGVRAYVYSCTDCSDPSTRFIGWLEKYSPEGKAAIEDPGSGVGFSAMQEGHLVKTVEGDEWIVATSDEGFQVVAAAQENCNEGQIPQPCSP